MTIIEVKTGKSKRVDVVPVNVEGLKILTKKRYFFSWKKEKAHTQLYKLCIVGEDDILGVMALVDVPGDRRMEIKLLVSSKENVGKEKMYDRIAGCLVGFACKESVKRYGDLACVSLKPKTELREHYRNKYGMIDAGLQLCVEGLSLIKLINKYLI
ncbi:MAG TPA: hypothetical protein VFN30_14310 [Chitinophagaceae bacterium]|nr:hypothetical protein [Chitinophagaceae bacterium]